MQVYTDIPIVKELSLTDAPVGQVSRYWVHIVSGGMGLPIMIPVLVARGPHEGPVLGITAAVHGNELNGLPVIQKVFQMINVGRLHGTLVGVPVMNVPGFLMNQRFFNDGRDLNRLMPGKPDGSTSEVYAHRLIKKVAHHFQYMIDLHTASFGRINSYYIRADMTNPITARMAELQNADILVNNAGGDGTLRSAVADLGIHAITVEAGDPQKFQRGMIRSAVTGIFNVMSDLKMVDDPIIPPDQTPVRCMRSYWIYTTAGGILEVFPKITEYVRKDQRIAIVRNIFGDITREYFAPEDGIVVGKSTNPVNQTGGRILHLGVQL
ncbi:MAG: succinylglutamate desuccinylase/aspartoacylase family protein [Bacteroidia bacterium]